MYAKYSFICRVHKLLPRTGMSAYAGLVLSLLWLSASRLSDVPPEKLDVTGY